MGFDFSFSQSWNPGGVEVVVYLFNHEGHDGSARKWVRVCRGWGR